MYPVMFSFQLPEWLGSIGWIEITATAAVFGVLALVGILRGRFRPKSLLIGAVIWSGLRAAIWFAGPGYQFKLHTYGLLIAIGFVTGITLVVRQARREQIDRNFVLDLSFYILIAALVGSRVVYIVVNLEEYLADPFKVLKVWEGGLVFYGGLIGAVGVAWTICAKRRQPFFRIADLFIPSVALGHFFGRLGCFMAGCCHGCATGSEWYGVPFYRAHQLDLLIHPTQLYEALGELALFFLLILWRQRKRYNGQLLVLWLFWYPLWRFGTELFRGDTERGLLFEVDLFGTGSPNLLSTSQIISLGLLALGLVLWWVLRSRRRAAGYGPPPGASSE